MTGKAGAVLGCIINDHYYCELDRRKTVTELLITALESGDAMSAALGDSKMELLGRADHVALVLVVGELAFRRDNGQSGMLMFPGLSEYIERRAKS